MSRAIRSCVLAVAALAVLTGCTGFPFLSPNFSHEVVLRAPSGTAATVSEHLRHRLDVAGITERSIDAKGDTVTVRYNPPQSGGKRAKVRDDLFTAAGVLGIRPVIAIGPDGSVSTDCTQEASPCTAAADKSEQLVLGPSTVTGTHVRKAEAVDVQGQWGVQLDFTDQGASALRKLTDAVSCQDDQQLKRMAILLDGKILTAPILQLECGQTLSDSAQIAGGLDHDAASQIAALLTTPLPAGVTLVSSTP
jgi:preprotein translocase subunit SecD